MSASDLNARLQRLRAHKIRRGLPARRSVSSQPLARTGLPGRAVADRLGTYYLVENEYPLDFQHGPLRLADALSHGPDIAARIARDDGLARAQVRQLAFVDTETTGLAGGAGTLAFLIGVGVFEAERFVVRQYFLPDPADEEAMLNAFVGQVAARAGWVTFNGRAFDLPLLETRLALIGQRGVLGRRPHLDLLPPARRLYRGRLPSCALGDIEFHVFHIRREQDDVTGGLIPQMYLDYLRTGDAGEMRRVIYHNVIDILSMVTLAAHLFGVFATPLGAGGQAPAGPPASDLLRLARWHAAQRRPLEAEQAYRRALEGRLELDERRQGLIGLADLLKRQDRRDEAAPLWEQCAAFTLDDAGPYIELAKYCEWHTHDLGQAIAWTERALAVAAAWPRGWKRTAAREALQHRLKRLKDKVK